MQSSVECADRPEEEGPLDLASDAGCGRLHRRHGPSHNKVAARQAVHTHEQPKKILVYKNTMPHVLYNMVKEQCKKPADILPLALMPGVKPAQYQLAGSYLWY